MRANRKNTLRCGRILSSRIKMRCCFCYGFRSPPPCVGIPGAAHRFRAFSSNHFHYSKNASKQSHNGVTSRLLLPPNDNAVTKIVVFTQGDRDVANFREPITHGVPRRFYTHLLGWLVLTGSNTIMWMVERAHCVK